MLIPQGGLRSAINSSNAQAGTILNTRLTLAIDEKFGTSAELVRSVGAKKLVFTPGQGARAVEIPLSAVQYRNLLNAISTAPAVRVSKEIERKWRVDPATFEAEFPDVTQCTHVRIEQGYAVIASDKTEIRVRSKTSGDAVEHILTIKGSGTLVRGEGEIEISKDQFDRIWGLTHDRSVSKERIKIQFGDRVLEVDRFFSAGPEKNLDGKRFLGEVEFPSVGASISFNPPACFVSEVTEDKAFKNQRLAVSGFPN